MDRWNDDEFEISCGYMHAKRNIKRYNNGGSKLLSTFGRRFELADRRYSMFHVKTSHQMQKEEAGYVRDISLMAGHIIGKETSKDLSD